MIDDPQESRLLARLLNEVDLSIEDKAQIMRAALEANRIANLPQWVKQLLDQVATD